MAEITIQGIDALMRKLNNAQDVNNVLRPPMQRSVFRLQRDMAQYPPARPNSSYIRTGTYGRRWTTQLNESGQGLTGEVGNNTAYGPFVGSQQFQAAIHRNRWLTDQRAVDNNRQRIVDDFEQAIQRALDE
jgi:hypothetical protein